MLHHSTAKILFTILCFILLVVGIYLARQVILVFILSILFTHLLEPVVQFLQRHSLLFRNLRGPAVVEVYLASVIVIGSLFFAFLPGVAKAPDSLLQNVVVSLDDLGNGNLIESIGDQYDWPPSRTLQLKQLIVSRRPQIHGLVENVEDAVPSVLGGLALVPILAVFFLQDGKIIVRATVYIVKPWGIAHTLEGMFDEIAIVLRAYTRTQALLAAFSLVFYWAVLFLFQTPHAIALGLVGAVLEFIPVAGWMVAAGAILIVSILSHSHWIWLGFLLLVWRCFQDYVNVPRVMGRHLQIHPLLSLFGIMVGFDVGGIVGVYLSIPLMAVTGVLWRRLFRSNLLQDERLADSALSH
jgi:predicted PurR-regulated permease PerM